MLLNYNYTNTLEQYVTNHSKAVNKYIHRKQEKLESVIFGNGGELDISLKKLQGMNNNEALCHVKSICYMESDNYRRILEFIEDEAFQICIMGHFCGNSDRKLNTLFEHRKSVSVKPYYYTI